jgi:hypothetical protein
MRSKRGERQERIIFHGSAILIAASGTDEMPGRITRSIFHRSHREARNDRSGVGNP